MSLVALAPTPFADVPGFDGTLASVSEWEARSEHLKRENARLSAELAKAERDRRRAHLQAEQRRAELEHDVRSLRALIENLVRKAPPLLPLVSEAQLEGFDGLRAQVAEVEAAAEAEEAKARSLASHATVLGDAEGAIPALKSENERLAARLVPGGRRPLFLLHVPQSGGGDDGGGPSAPLFAENMRLAAENWRLAKRAADHDAVATELAAAASECDRLGSERDALASQLARTERERRRLVLLEEQGRVDLVTALSGRSDAEEVVEPPCSDSADQPPQLEVPQSLSTKRQRRWQQQWQQGPPVHWPLEVACPASPDTIVAGESEPQAEPQHLTTPQPLHLDDTGSLSAAGQSEPTGGCTSPPTPLVVTLAGESAGRGGGCGCGLASGDVLDSRVAASLERLLGRLRALVYDSDDAPSPSCSVVRLTQLRGTGSYGDLRPEGEAEGAPFAVVPALEACLRTLELRQQRRQRPGLENHLHLPLADRRVASASRPWRTLALTGELAATPLVIEHDRVKRASQMATPAMLPCPASLVAVSAANKIVAEVNRWVPEPAHARAASARGSVGVVGDSTATSVETRRAGCIDEDYRGRCHNVSHISTNDGIAILGSGLTCLPPVAERHVGRWSVEPLRSEMLADYVYIQEELALANEERRLLQEELHEAKQASIERAELWDRDARLPGEAETLAASPLFGEYPFCEDIRLRTTAALDRARVEVLRKELQRMIEYPQGSGNNSVNDGRNRDGLLDGSARGMMHEGGVACEPVAFSALREVATREQAPMSPRGTQHAPTLPVLSRANSPTDLSRSLCHMGETAAQAAAEEFAASVQAEDDLPYGGSRDDKHGRAAAAEIEEFAAVGREIVTLEHAQEWLVAGLAAMRYVAELTERESSVAAEITATESLARAQEAACYWREREASAEEHKAALEAGQTLGGGRGRVRPGRPRASANLVVIQPSTVSPRPDRNSPSPRPDGNSPLLLPIARHKAPSNAAHAPGEFPRLASPNENSSVASTFDNFSDGELGSPSMRDRFDLGRRRLGGTTQARPGERLPMGGSASVPTANVFRIAGHRRTVSSGKQMQPSILRKSRGDQAAIEALWADLGLASLPFSPVRVGIRRGSWTGVDSPMFSPGRRTKQNRHARTSPAMNLPSREAEPPRSDSPCSLASDVLNVSRREASPRFERALVEAFFVIDDAEGGDSRASSLRLCWPESLRGGKLESAVVHDGFCPNPVTFRRESPQGCGGEAFIFSLLETTLCEQGDPSTLLYGCVCGEGGAREWLPEGEDARGGVLCIITRFPLFAFLFGVLRIVGRDVACAAVLLQRLNSWGLTEGLLCGLDVSDLYGGEEPGALALSLPRPLACTWADLADSRFPVAPLGGTAQTLARWQAAWAVETILARWPNLIGDTLAKLLACILLEQKVLLLGDAPRTSAAALLLRAVMWPFRWLHLFVCAPPPVYILNEIPLVESPSPFVLALGEFPPKWGYRTPYELPPDVVTGVLNHDYVYVHPELETSGGIRSGGLKLPGGRHAAFVKRVAQERNKLKNGQQTAKEAALAVQQACEAEVERLADVVRQYAAAQVAAARSAQLYGGASLAPRSAADLRQLCTHQAARPDEFDRWLNSEAVAAHFGAGGQETQAFYRTLFQTQLCNDFLYEEITAQTQRAPDDLALALVSASTLGGGGVAPQLWQA